MAKPFINAVIVFRSLENCLINYNALTAALDAFILLLSVAAITFTSCQLRQFVWH